MKHLLSLILFASLQGHLAAQVPFAKFEVCKQAEVTLLAGDVFPANFVVLSLGSFVADPAIISIETMTPALIKEMKKRASKLHCCSVFVDFKNIVGNFSDGEGNDPGKIHIHYFILRPLYYFMKEN